MLFFDDNDSDNDGDDDNENDDNDGEDDIYYVFLIDIISAFTMGAFLIGASISSLPSGIMMVLMMMVVLM